MEQNTRHCSDTIKSVKMDALLFCLNLHRFSRIQKQEEIHLDSKQKKRREKTGRRIAQDSEVTFFTFSNREEQDDIIWLWDINRKEGTKNMGERQECHERYGYPLLQS